MPPSSPLCDHHSTQSIRQENNLVVVGRPSPPPCRPIWALDELHVRGGEHRGLLGPPVTGETLSHAPHAHKTPSHCFPAISERPMGCQHPPASHLHQSTASPSPNTISEGSCLRHQHLPQWPAFRRPSISKKRLCPQMCAQLTPQPTHQSIKVFSRTCSSCCSNSH